MEGTVLIFLILLLEIIWENISFKLCEKKRPKNDTIHEMTTVWKISCYRNQSNILYSVMVIFEKKKKMTTECSESSILQRRIIGVIRALQYFVKDVITGLN